MLFYQTNFVWFRILGIYMIDVLHVSSKIWSKSYHAFFICKYNVGRFKVFCTFGVCTTTPRYSINFFLDEKFNRGSTQMNVRITFTDKKNFSRRIIIVKNIKPFVKLKYFWHRLWKCISCLHYCLKHKKWWPWFFYLDSLVYIS